jgi:hypothetical protein
LARKKKPHDKLFLIDIANWVGSGNFDDSTCGRWRRAFLAVENFGPTDIMYVSTGPGTKNAVAWEWPTGRFKVAQGRDGADAYLNEQISNPVYIAKNFRHVVLGSGDHYFFDNVKALVELGVKVTILFGRGKVYRRYYSLDVEIVDLRSGWGKVS